MAKTIIIDTPSKLKEYIAKAVKEEFKDMYSIRDIIYEDIRRLTEEYIRSIIKEKTIELKLPQIVREEVKRILRNDFQEFANDLWNYGQQRFTKILTQRLKNMVNLKTSTIQEIKQNIEDNPATISDKEWIEQVIKLEQRDKLKLEFKK